MSQLSRSRSPRPATQKAVSKLQQWKHTLQAIRQSALDPVLNALGSAVMEVLDVAETVQENKEEYRSLAEKLAMRTNNLLKRAEDADLDDDFRQMVEHVKIVAQEIHEQMEKEQKRHIVNRLGSSSKSKQEVDKLNKKLENVLAGFQLDAIVEQRFLLRRSQGASLTQDAGSEAAHVPSDLPVVQLPPRPQIFFGRDELVKSIVAGLLGDDPCRIPILGAGGIGKTSVAAAVLHDERIDRKYGRHRIFISCEGATSAQDIVKTLAAALKLLCQDDSTRALMGYLISLHCEILLVLDNLETAWDSEDRNAVGELLARFTNIAQLSLIITMRGDARPTQVAWSSPLVCNLGSLDREAARATFIRISGEPDSNLDELLALLDGLPLAITLMAYQGQLISPIELVAAYKEESTRLLSAGTDDRLSSLEVSIRLSLNCFTMRKNPHAQQLLSILSLLPDGISNQALPGVVPSMANRAEAARILMRVGLVVREGSVLRVLAPIRDFMLHDFPPGGVCLAELQHYYMNMVSRANEIGTISGSKATKDLAPQFGNLHAVLMYTWTFWPAIPCRAALGQSTQDLACFSHLSSYGDCSALLRKAIVALKGSDERMLSLAYLSIDVGLRDDLATGNAEDTTSVTTFGPNFGKHQLLAARLMRWLGEICHMQDRDDDAIAQLTEAQTAFDQIGDRRGAAECMRSLGDISAMQDRYDDAVCQLTEARATFDAIGDLLGGAQCLQRLGDISHMRSQDDDAVVKLKDAWTAYGTIGSPLGAAQCMKSLGVIAGIQHRYDDAVAMLTDARNTFDTIGCPLGAAQCMQSLGDTSCMQSQYDHAVVQLTDARAAFDTIGSRLGAAQCMKSLGEISRMQNRYDDAVVQLTEARAAFDAIGERLGAAQCLQKLGGISNIQNRYKDAITQITEARAVFDMIGSRLGAAQSMQHLGKIARRQNRYEDAVVMFTEARSASDAIGDSLGSAQCVQQLGDISRMQNQYDGAVVWLTEARSTFERIGHRLGIAQCMQSLGDIARMQHRYDDAVVMLLEARTASDAIGYSLGGAQCNQKLGEISVMQDRYDDAIAQITAARTAFATIGDRLGTAECMRSLGNISRLQSKYDDAVEQLRAARATFNAIGNPLGATQCMQKLGEVALAQNRHDDAIAQLTDARTAFDTIGNRLGAAQCLRILGDISRMQSQYNNAVAQLTEARVAFDKMSDPFGVAQCIQSLGMVSCMQNRLEESAILLTEARVAFGTLGNRLGVAQCRNQMGMVYFRQGDYITAAQHIQNALELYTQLGRLQDAEISRNMLVALSVSSPLS